MCAGETSGGQAGLAVVRTLGFVIVGRPLGLVRLGSVPDAKDVEIGLLATELRVPQNIAGPATHCGHMAPSRHEPNHRAVRPRSPPSEISR